MMEDKSMDIINKQKQNMIRHVENDFYSDVV